MLHGENFIVQITEKIYVFVQFIVKMKKKNIIILKNIYYYKNYKLCMCIRMFIITILKILYNLCI